MRQPFLLLAFSLALCLPNPCWSFTVAPDWPWKRSIERHFPLSASTRSTTSVPTVDGLVDDFERLDALHDTLVELRQQIPRLLNRPLSDEDGGQIYRRNVTLSVAGADGDDYELAASRNELLSLSNTLVLALSASNRASKFLAGRGSEAIAPSVECSIVVVNQTCIEVEWEAQFLPLVSETLRPANATRLTILQGYSQLLLDDAGLVTAHRLLQVRWNNQVPDGRTIGQSLSAIRRSVQSLSNLPILKSLRQGSSAFRVLTQVGEELLQAQLSESMAESLALLPVKPAPIYLLSHANGDINATVRVSVEDLDRPFSGSSQWPVYAAAHRVVVDFVERGLPALSGKVPDDLSTWFASDASLIGLDQGRLLQGRDRLARFYATLAAWRQRTFGSWTLQSARLVDWTKHSKVEVNYTVTMTLPGLSPVRVTGTDVYRLATPGSSAQAKIVQVNQTHLAMGENINRQDNLLFMRSLVAATETGRFGTTEESMLKDVWQRLSRGEPLAKPATVTKPVVARSDEAAATVYRIMDSLLTEIPNLVNTAATTNKPLLSDYLDESVQLLGYLDEPFARGRATYLQSTTMAVTTLRTALRTGRVVAEKDPSIHVELKADRNVRFSFTLPLRIKPLPDFVVPSDGAKIMGGLPFELSILSDLILDADSGRIMRHKLRETRVNGQLTPGDVVSRWIQQLRGIGSDLPADNTDRLLKSLGDVASWIRSFDQQG